MLHYNSYTGNDEKVSKDDSALNLGVEVGLLELFVILSADLPNNCVAKDEEILEALAQYYLLDV